jgi:hypothetical protein
MARRLSVDEFNRRVDAMMSSLPNDLLTILEQEALVAKKDVNKRIVDKGESHTGAKLPEYTPAYLQFKKDVGRYRGHVDLQLGNWSVNKRLAAVRARRVNQIDKAKYFGKGAETNLKKRISKKAARQKEKDSKAGRRTRNIAQGGTLWASIQLTTKTVEGSKARVVVAPIDNINRKKASGLAVKRGDFLSLSKEEIKRRVDSFQDKFTKLVVIKLKP